MYYTIRFQLKPFLAEYLYGHFASVTDKGVIHLPPRSYLSNSLHELLGKRPCNAPAREAGNLCLRLPNPHRGKSPTSYNYLTQSNIRIFENRVQHLFHAELFDRMLTDRRQQGISYAESVRRFIEHYHIESISEEGLLKAFWRWRKEAQRNPYA